MEEYISAKPEIKGEFYLIEPTGQFPNSRFPIIIYRKISEEDPTPEYLKNLFLSNKWNDAWTGGIYNSHHYHSTAHEVLGILKGCGKVQFGGPSGQILELNAGDVVIIPAGVAHKNLGATHDFKVVGAYPEGQNYDMNYGEQSERPYTDKRIEELNLPKSDPVYGKDGDLLKHWK